MIDLGNIPKDFSGRFCPIRLQPFDALPSPFLADSSHHGGLFRVGANQICMEQIKSLFAGEGLQHEDYSVNLACDFGDLRNMAEKIIHHVEQNQINEIFVRCTEADIDDRLWKCFLGAPDFYARLRMVIPMLDVRPASIERASLFTRVLLTGECDDPFVSEYQKTRDIWRQTLLWATSKINVAFSEKAFYFLEPYLVPRLMKPTGHNPKTFLVYEGLLFD